MTQPRATYKHKRYSIRPGRIEDYEPGKSSLASLEEQSTPSANYLIDKPGDHCNYIENISNKEYLIQKPLNPIAVPVISGHQLYQDVQRGGDIPLTGLHIKDHSKRFTISVRRHSSSCIFYPRSLSEPRQNSKKHGRPCLSPFTQNKFLPVNPAISLSALLSCRDDIKSRKARDEINNARKKEMEIVLKSVKEKRKIIEEEETKARRHSDKYVCNSPISVDRYNFDDETNCCKTQHQSRPKAVVMHNFRAKHPREISLKKDDVVYIWRTVDINWLEVEHHGAVGLFPLSYVKFLKPSDFDIEEKTSHVKFDFNAQLSREISVKKGDQVKILGRIDKNWILIEKDEKIGLVPSTYIDLELGSTYDLDDNKTSDPCSAAESTNVSDSLSNESLIKCRSTTPLSVSSSTKPHMEKLNSNFPMLASSDNLSSPQEANKNASDLLPYVKCIVIQSYRPQEIDELLLSKGDVVHVTEIFNDGWFVGISMRTKQCGTFPGICVRKL